MITDTEDLSRVPEAIIASGTWPTLRKMGVSIDQVKSNEEILTQYLANDRLRSSGYIIERPVSGKLLPEEDYDLWARQMPSKIRNQLGLRKGWLEWQIWAKQVQNQAERIFALLNRENSLLQRIKRLWPSGRQAWSDSTYNIGVASEESSWVVEEIFDGMNPEWRTTWPVWRVKEELHDIKAIREWVRKTAGELANQIKPQQEEKEEAKKPFRPATPFISSLLSTNKSPQQNPLRSQERIQKASSSSLWPEKISRTRLSSPTVDGTRWKERLDTTTASGFSAFPSAWRSNPKGSEFGFSSSIPAVNDAKEENGVNGEVDPDEMLRGFRKTRIGRKPVPEGMLRAINGLLKTRDTVIPTPLRYEECPLYTGNDIVDMKLVLGVCEARRNDSGGLRFRNGDM